jgi:hypothetical protein
MWSALLPSGAGRSAMRAILSVFASCLLLVSITHAAEKSAPGQQTIKEILAGAKRWTLLFEFTPDNLPGDRVSTTELEFFWRGPELVGRTTKMGAFNCELKLKIRDDGFEFQRCGGFTETSMAVTDYYPDDRTYPFKRLNSPQKIWLTPKPE